MEDVKQRPDEASRSTSPDGRTPQPTLYGPANPHPLSRLRTELVWEGKYDEFGNRRGVDAAGLAMPMQRIETIDEPRARAEAQGGLFDAQKAHLDDFRNALVWGDNMLVAASLLRDFKGQIDLIYIDPPFDVGIDFSMDVPIGDSKDTVAKDQSALEVVAYRDTWGKGVDSYLHMLYERLVLMRELLRETGTLFVHCDWRLEHLVRGLLDDVFGKSGYRNTLIWRRDVAGKGAKGKSRQFPRNADTILFYTKGDSWQFHQPYTELSDEQKKAYRYRDSDGRLYKAVQLGDYSEASITRMRESGLIHTSSSGAEYKKYYVDEAKAMIDTLWTDIAGFGTRTAAKEITGFATQKPEALLERILTAGSEEGQLVADFFCGSGTTGAVAERLGRRWLMADLGRFAVHTSRKRLIEVQRELHSAGRTYRAFDVLNLGRYERQWWQQERLKGADEEHRRVVLEFFKAEILSNPPSPLIHGRKGIALCHVDSIDTIFTREEAKVVAEAAAGAGAKQVICLSWEFEMDLRLECNRFEKELAIEIRLIQIPREIMEKNRKEPPPFLEVATLSAKPVFGEEDGRKTVDIELTSFIPSLAEVPTKELEELQERAMSSSFDFIDFWAVDFDYSNGGPFHHDWQDYRLRKERSLKTTSSQRYVYPGSGTYTACVKVVDIFGCDTSISVEVAYG
jgi:adenine-specific DNA-methyltransferase